MINLMNTQIFNDKVKKFLNVLTKKNSISNYINNFSVILLINVTTTLYALIQYYIDVGKQKHSTFTTFTMFLPFIVSLHTE